MFSLSPRVIGIVLRNIMPCQHNKILCPHSLKMVLAVCNLIINDRKCQGEATRNQKAIKYKLTQKAKKTGKKKLTWSSLVAQRVQNLMSLQWLGPLLWHRFSPQPKNFYMPWVWQRKKQTTKNPTRFSGNKLVQSLISQVIMNSFSSLTSKVIKSECKPVITNRPEKHPGVSEN